MWTNVVGVYTYLTRSCPHCSRRTRRHHDDAAPHLHRPTHNDHVITLTNKIDGMRSHLPIYLSLSRLIDASQVQVPGVAMRAAPLHAPPMPSSTLDDGKLRLGVKSGVTSLVVRFHSSWPVTCHPKD